MAIFARVPLEKVMPHMQASGKRELVWYGVTIGQIGFGVLASVKRQPTKREADVCHKCGKTDGNHTAWCDNQLWTSTTRR